MKKVSQSASLTYKLEFKKSTLKELQKLGATLQQQLKKKLIERLDHPHVPASKGRQLLQDQKTSHFE